MEGPPGDLVPVDPDDVPVGVHHLVLDHVLCAGAELGGLRALVVDSAAQEEPAHAHVGALRVDHGEAVGREVAQDAVPRGAGAQADQAGGPLQNGGRNEDSFFNCTQVCINMSKVFCH